MASAAYYESDRTREEYLAFHYPDGDPLRDLLGPEAPPLERRYPWCARGFWDADPRGAALDVGCACGAVTLLLARDHAAAVGIDRSRRLVAAAEEVRRSGRARYRQPLEGDLGRDVDVPVEAPEGARFAVADALALPFADGRFSTVLALNLVDRVPDPARALAEALRVTRPGGVLVVSSPFTWLEECAPRARWLGGVSREGRAVRGPEGVAAALGPGARLERAEDRPFFIPHHARSGQVALAHIQRFRRTS